MTSTAAAPTTFDEAELLRIEGRLKTLVRRRVAEPLPAAAVLVPLCLKDGVPAVLFTKRSDRVGTHKGQVSFPGGRKDEGDVDDVECALRELHEEVGIGPSSVRVLGTFHDILSITGMRVTPVVGFVGELGDLRSLVVQQAEIDFAFMITVADLLAPGQRVGMQLGGRGTFPAFTAGPERVWGLTAFILDEVLEQALGITLPPL